MDLPPPVPPRSYARDYASARFCLAAPGGGWGKRGIVAAMYGCIPVIATDFLYEVRPVAAPV